MIQEIKDPNRIAQGYIESNLELTAELLLLLIEDDLAGELDDRVIPEMEQIIRAGLEGRWSMYTEKAKLTRFKRIAEILRTFEDELSVKDHSKVKDGTHT